jgi:glycerophosphoryl diester phosphodiesterase
MPRTSLKTHYPALEEADRLGADYVEFDIRHTQDGVPILMHDKTLKRMAKSKDGHNCDLKTSISQQTYEQIQDHCVLSTGEEIPTLAQALNAFSGSSIKLGLDLKDKPSVRFFALASLHFFFNRDKAYISAFSEKILDRVLRFLPWFEGRTYYHALTPWQFNTEHHHGVWQGVYVLKKKYLQSTEKNVAVWTVDKLADIEKYFDLGVDLLITNELEVCLDVKRQNR